jgi:hypothetical protein
MAFQNINTETCFTALGREKNCWDHYFRFHTCLSLMYRLQETKQETSEMKFLCTGGLSLCTFHNAADFLIVPYKGLYGYGGGGERLLKFNLCHRVDILQRFLSSRWNWDPPPLTRRRVCPPPPDSHGRGIGT